MISISDYVTALGYLIAVNQGLAPKKRGKYQEMANLSTLANIVAAKDITIEDITKDNS